MKSIKYHHLHHHVAPSARISLTLTRNPLLSSGSSSELHPVLAQSCCMYVRAGRLAFARPYEAVHWSTSLMSSSLLLQQCPACLVRLIWIEFVMGGKWLFSCCFVGCCLSNVVCNNLKSIDSGYFLLICTAWCDNYLQNYRKRRK